MIRSVDCFGMVAGSGKKQAGNQITTARVAAERELPGQREIRDACHEDYEAARQIQYQAEQLDRDQELARVRLQAAEAALRYCEEKVTSEFTSLPMLVNYQKDEEWLDEAVWAGPAKLEVPREQLGLPDNIKKNPQCLFRYLTIDDWFTISDN